MDDSLEPSGPGNPLAESDAAWRDIGLIGTPHDFLSRSGERYSAVVRAGALVLWRADLAGRMVAIAGWDRLTGRPDAEALQRGFLEQFHPDDRHLLDYRNRETGEAVQADGRVLDRDGHWRWVRCRGVLIPPSYGFPAEWVGTIEDVHDQRRALDRARYMAERDALTGLGNRRTLSGYLTSLCDKRAGATVVMLDVDRFKAINDLHGLQLGDRFLVRLGQMLVAAAPAHSVCARMGGDEFCVVVVDTDEARALCERLSRASTGGMSIGDLVLPLAFGAGIADADWDEPDPVSTVLRKADLALRRAKSTGAGVVVHDPAIQAEADAGVRLLRAIGPACRNNEFFLEYQPIINVDTGAAASFEALIRWQHPQLGRIEPSVFVPLAEQNGMIGALGRWVLTRVCADLALAEPWVRANLNVSGRQLADPGFADEVIAILREHGIAPQRITIELTESVRIGRLAGGGAIARLRAQGFRIVLDDFGTEYAMLSHVSSGHFDGIKLSREFIGECCRGERARLVLRHMVSLCDDLGMVVVAEGVENESELNCLRQQGVRLMQGYHFDRPREMVGQPGAAALGPGPGRG